MNKKESKYFCTAAKMDTALIELLEKKDFEYITVKEVCEKAGVNRSTFYLHYENTVDLLNEATRYVLDNFLSYFGTEKEIFSFDPRANESNDLIFICPEYVIPYLTYIKDNQGVFKTALRHFGAMGFDTYYEKMFCHIFSPILERFGVSPDKRRYVMKFYLTGVTAIVMEWLENGCLDPIDKICGIIVDCTVGLYEKSK